MASPAAYRISFRTEEYGFRIRLGLRDTFTVTSMREACMASLLSGLMSFLRTMRKNSLNATSYYTVFTRVTAGASVV